VRPVNNAIAKFVGADLPKAYFNEPLVLKNTSDPKMLYEFLIYWVTHPKASVYPNNFSTIYPYEWDVTYSTTSKSYTAGDNGYPVGNLNAWPTLKTQWAQGIVLKSASRPVTVNGLEIRQNFPNPFTDRTAVCFTTNKDQKVEVAVYNWLGQKTRTLVNKYMKTGDYSIDWDGTNDAGAHLPKGMYLIQITGSETQGKVAMKLIKN
jgi:hypothetical protein